MVVRRARKQLTKIFSLARKTAENDELANKSRFGKVLLRRKTE